MDEPSVERWGVFELALDGPSSGNPFVDVALRAQLTFGGRSCEIDGFYDGDGTYRIRFSPDQPGEWTYRTESNVSELHGRTGEFRCVPATGTNRGPVRVANTFHFFYADGTPYYPFGTTSYAWTHQGDDLEDQTLETLATSPFNKIRMCVFPKHYPYNENEPLRYPFERSATGEFDVARFDRLFFAGVDDGDVVVPDVRRRTPTELQSSAEATRARGRTSMRVSVANISTIKYLTSR